MEHRQINVQVTRGGHGRFRHWARESWGGFSSLPVYSLSFTLLTCVGSCSLQLCQLLLPEPTQSLSGVCPDGHLLWCDMKEEIMSHTICFYFNFLARLLCGEVGGCPGELTGALGNDRPGECPCHSTPVMICAWIQMWKDRWDSSSGCEHVAHLTGEAGSEVGSTAYEQTYYCAISKVCMDCWGVREWKSSLDRLAQCLSHYPMVKSHSRAPYLCSCM